MLTIQNEFGQPIGAPVPGWVPCQRPGRESMTGRFCRVEPLDPDRHAAGLFASDTAQPDEASWTYLPYGPFTDLQKYEDWMRSYCQGDDPLFFAIVDLARQQPVGMSSYLRVTPTHGVIEVGHLHFSPAMRQTPIATEAMFLMMQRAFTLGYRRYEWKCNSLNAPSRSAAQRLGFSFEGIFRQAAVHKGRSRDTAWYAIIDSDWPSLRDAFLQWLNPDNFDDDGRQRTSLSELTRPLLKNRG